METMIIRPSERRLILRNTLTGSSLPHRQEALVCYQHPVPLNRMRLLVDLPDSLILRDCVNHLRKQKQAFFYLKFHRLIELGS
jgi:hypothetical protein